ncbi:MAG: hypothetical protein WAM63_06270, partial [Rhodomicrobium sp.]
ATIRKILKSCGAKPSEAFASIILSSLRLTGHGRARPGTASHVPSTPIFSSRHHRSRLKSQFQTNLNERSQRLVFLGGASVNAEMVNRCDFNYLPPHNS